MGTTIYYIYDNDKDDFYFFIDYEKALQKQKEYSFIELFGRKVRKYHIGVLHQEDYKGVIWLARKYDEGKMVVWAVFTKYPKRNKEFFEKNGWDVESRIIGR